MKERYSTIPLMTRVNEMANKLCESNYKGKRTRAKIYVRLLNESSNFRKDYKTLYKEFF